MAVNWTAEHLKALDEAIALGVRKVEYHDKYVEYKSLDDMLRVRRLIMGALNPAVGVGRMRVYASLSKGTRP